MDSQQLYTCRNGVLYKKISSDQPFYEKVYVCGNEVSSPCKTIEESQYEEKELIFFKEGKELYRKSPHTDAEKNNAPIYLLEGHAFLENNVLYKD